VLRAWRTKALLGGVELPSDAKDDALDQLAQWAAADIGPLDQPISATEHYVISGVKLPCLD
jgi:hypothetical protein